MKQIGEVDENDPDVFTKLEALRKEALKKFGIGAQ